MALSCGGTCFDGPESPGHTPGIESDDDKNIQWHAENDIEHGHKEDGLLQNQRLEKHL